MFCVLRGHNFQHEIQTIGQIFFPNENFSLTAEIPGEGTAVESVLEPSRGLALGRLYVGGELKSEKAVRYEGGPARPFPPVTGGELKSEKTVKYEGGGAARPFPPIVGCELKSEKAVRYESGGAARPFSPIVGGELKSEKAVRYEGGGAARPFSPIGGGELKSEKTVRYEGGGASRPFSPVAGGELKSEKTVRYEGGEAARSFSPIVGGEGAADVRGLRHALMTALFLACKEHTGLRTPWGSLTGIRPSKLVRLLSESGMSDGEVFAELSGRYFAEPEKIRLSQEVARAEGKILAGQIPGAMSLYIGIPFCPSTCLYCSFASYPLEAGGPKKRLYWAEARRRYMDALFKELDYLGKYFASRPLETIYIGGGTPTALDEDELRALLERVRLVFPEPREFSAEAGRPDSLSREKLRLLKRYGVGRISINPQSMNDETLERIGRKHTVADIARAFELAREEGHDNVNADVILGLPGESPEDVERTMAGLADLAPESVTVHTLAVKRASRLRETLAERALASVGEMEEMLKIIREACAGMGMSPYYLYRQKNMVGNFENVGYCLPGRESRYNVYIMEETQTIWAAGAGAASKIIFPCGLIKRVFNVKNLEDYIDRIDEMIGRKEEMGVELAIGD